MWDNVLWLWLCVHVYVCVLWRNSNWWILNKTMEFLTLDTFIESMQSDVDSAILCVGSNHLHSHLDRIYAVISNWQLITDHFITWIQNVKERRGEKKHIQNFREKKTGTFFVSLRVKKNCVCWKKPNWMRHIHSESMGVIGRELMSNKNISFLLTLSECALEYVATIHTFRLYFAHQLFQRKK